MNPNPSSLSPRVRAVVIGAMIFTAAFYALSCVHGRHLDWNAMRLAPAAALIRWQAIYPMVDSGPITGHIYTPFAALAYAPVAWMDDISLMMTSAGLLAVAYFSLPFIWLASLAVRHRQIAGWDAAGVTVAALLIAALHPALRYAAVMVHAEAPAVGLAGLAVIAAGYHRSLGKPGCAWAGALAVCAVLAKQTMLPAWVALVAGVGFRFGSKAALQYVVGSGLVAGVFVVWTTAFGSWQALFYNCVWIPGHHPWATGKYSFAFGTPPTGQSLLERAVALGEAFVQHAPAVWPLFALAAWCIVRYWRRGVAADQPVVHAAVMAAFVAGAQFPLALASLVKVGGDLNNLAPLLSPLLLMLMVLALHAYARASGPVVVSLRLGLGLTLLVLVGCNVPRAVFLARSFVTRPESNRPMLAFLREHPQQTYLPWNPLHTWVVEKRQYHFEYGVFDRALAGRPLTREHYRKHLPSALRWVAVRRDQPQSGRAMFLHYLPELRETASPPGLEAWLFYEFGAPSASQQVPHRVHP